jgi:hypothetical protein
VFATRLVTPTVSFTGTVKGHKTAQPKPPPQHQTQPFAGVKRRRRKNRTKKRRGTSQARQQVTTTSTLDNMFKAVIVVQQIMSELNESVSEGGKIMAINSHETT